MRGIEVRTAGKADAGLWNRFVETHDSATVYHRWEWGEIISGAMRLRRRYLFAIDDGRVTGVLPLIQQANPVQGRFLTSLPFVNYGGLAATGPAAERALIQEAEAIVRRWKASYAELRSRPGVELGLPRAEKKHRAVLELPGRSDELWRRFPAKLRSQVRRPTKEGAVVVFGGQDFVPDFYRVLSVKWRDLGSPIPPRRFFERVVAKLPDRTTVCLVRCRRKTIGAGLMVFDRDSAEMVWAATLRRYDRIGTNMLMYWSAMCYAIERGSRLFDFGRSSPDSGTFRFKRQWGARDEPLPWYYVGPPDGSQGAEGPDGLAGRVLRTIWRRLPVSASRLFGPVLARRIPL